MTSMNPSMQQPFPSAVRFSGSFPWRHMPGPGPLPHMPNPAAVASPGQPLAADAGGAQQMLSGMGKAGGDPLTHFGLSGRFRSAPAGAGASCVAGAAGVSGSLPLGKAAGATMPFGVTPSPNLPAPAVPAACPAYADPVQRVASPFAAAFLDRWTKLGHSQEALGPLLPRIAAEFGKEAADELRAVLGHEKRANPFVGALGFLSKAAPAARAMAPAARAAAPAAKAVAGFGDDAARLAAPVAKAPTANLPAVWKPPAHRLPSPTPRMAPPGGGGLPPGGGGMPPVPPAGGGLLPGGAPGPWRQAWDAASRYGGHALRAAGGGLTGYNMADVGQDGGLDAWGGALAGGLLGARYKSLAPGAQAFARRSFAGSNVGGGVGLLGEQLGVLPQGSMGRMAQIGGWGAAAAPLLPKGAKPYVDAFGEGAGHAQIGKAWQAVKGVGPGSIGERIARGAGGAANLASWGALPVGLAAKGTELGGQLLDSRMKAGVNKMLTEASGGQINSLEEVMPMVTAAKNGHAGAMQFLDSLGSLPDQILGAFLPPDQLAGMHPIRKWLMLLGGGGLLLGGIGGMAGVPGGMPLAALGGLGLGASLLPSLFAGGGQRQQQPQSGNPALPGGAAEAPLQPPQAPQPRASVIADSNELAKQQQR